MQNIYFIDNESIKRTAKAIQKTNPAFKHTVILNDLALLLGYDSYNHYEHYLTNIVLSKNTQLNKLKVLTKIDSINLLILQNKFKEELEDKGYVINGLYFINKVIENQKKGFIEHSYLSLYSYIYYLPLIYLNSEKIDDNYLYNSNDIVLESIIKLVKSEYEIMGVNEIHEIVQEITLADDYSSDETLLAKFEALSKDLRTRGIYYYIKSILDNFEYDEGILSGMILKGYCTERILHELNVRLNKLEWKEREIPVFFKNEILTNINSFFPLIKEVVTESNPIMFGRHIDSTPFFVNNDYLHSNISLLGIPGSGAGAWLYSMVFQFLMHNRGCCIINPIHQVYSDLYVDKIASSLNKKNDVLKLNRGNNTKLIANSIHNEKLLLINGNTGVDYRRQIDYEKLGNEYFNLIIKDLSEHFFTSKFRNKKIPYYIIVDEAHNLEPISEETKRNIKKLNNLNIYFIFQSQIHRNFINALCDLTVITNYSINCYEKSDSFEFSQIIKGIKSKQNILGQSGPSKSSPPVFSVIYKNEFKDQFIIEIDEKLFEND